MNRLRVAASLTATVGLVVTALVVAQAQTKPVDRDCSRVFAEGEHIPAQDSVVIEGTGLDARFEVPENFIVLNDFLGFISIFSPRDYNYIECAVTNNVTDSAETAAINVALAEITVEELLSDDNRRDSEIIVIGSTQMGGESAVIYTTKNGLYIVQANHPDQNTSLIVSTDMKDGELPMNDTFERILESLRFL